MILIYAKSWSIAEDWFALRRPTGQERKLIAYPTFSSPLIYTNFTAIYYYVFRFMFNLHIKLFR